MPGFAGCSMMRATSAREDGAFLLCGLDEAGRGPLAGPVVASAVILPDDFPRAILNDSKKLSVKKRELAEKIIKEKACWGIGIVSHTVIDKINILEASLLAMKEAYEALSAKFDGWRKAAGVSAKTICAVADGTFCPDIECECRSEVKADAKYASVMAASILAKTCRDTIMIEMDKLYPAYGYARHKGYPTAEHRRICRDIGPSPIQRLTFRY
ncbi:ribonuclease HII [Treponema socranskii subsp. socranskii VPI DR56BR1116 = ATCC 35536]|uniref:Ribonuclease n=2 Tax=Treponema socranskii TaxID=53419 RepID=U1FIW0_TRESO|nr:ribonuclease HII [Treponema socranskii subsp. socranskii VPI DR56BR1116 = ATCC 35536]ERK04934.1 ribonuclease HII [Treponema socranskii subsp. socranskii VPI DR56BR1116 = ATCC 35536]